MIKLSIFVSIEKSSSDILLDIGFDEQDEISIIETFLPQQKNNDETEEIIKNIIKENKFTSIKEMGKLMNILKSDYLGQIDMGLAGKIAKSTLGK